MIGQYKVAVLLTCHNRRKKTIHCLKSLFEAELPLNYLIDVYLTDDGSTDGTADSVKEMYSNVIIIQGNGNLFWAGGMRLAWTEARKQNYDGYLLLNDDTFLYPDALIQIRNTHNYSIGNYQQGGIYVGTTNDPITKEYTYGGHCLLNRITGHSKKIEPKSELIQSCDFANANILFVSKNVVETIGILSKRFTHVLADYDYTLNAGRKYFPVLVCSNYCGSCEDDHDKPWLSNKNKLSDRIKYLKSPKHLAYKEYLFFTKYHFPFSLPLIFFKLWLKTLLPAIWDKYKR